MTSLAFMFDEVPDPVWNTSTGNSASQAPSATSSAAATMASADGARRPRARRRAPALARAASAFTSASARMRRRLIGRPEIGKFSTARWVCAPHLAAPGTWTSPSESCSTRNPSSPSAPGMAAPYRAGPPRGPGGGGISAAGGRRGRAAPPSRRGRPGSARRRPAGARGTAGPSRPRRSRSGPPVRATRR